VPKARGGYRGHGMIYDHMMLDGLEDAYDRAVVGTFGEDCAAKYHFTRGSRMRSRWNRCAAPSAPPSRALPLGDRAGDGVGQGRRYRHRHRRRPRRIKVDKIPSLKPAFAKDGTITAASSSSINDGAAALVMMRESTAKSLGLQPIARMLGHTSHAQAPGWFTTAPVEAIAKLYRKLDWTAAASICSKSTRRLPWCRWPRCTISTFRTTRSTSTAAHARWAIRSALRARAS
jgi:acetyl-CoA C-acetyltransferase